jgi:hypothetical protein
LAASGWADHLVALGREDLVEGATELRIAVVDQETEGLLIAEVHDEVARLLGDPASVWICGARDVLAPAGGKGDHLPHRRRRDRDAGALELTAMRR